MNIHRYVILPTNELDQCFVPKNGATKFRKHLSKRLVDIEAPHTHLIRYPYDRGYK